MTTDEIVKWINSIYQEENDINCFILPILKLLNNDNVWVDRETIVGSMKHHDKLNHGRGVLRFDHLWPHRITRGGASHMLSALVEYEQGKKGETIKKYRIKDESKEALSKAIEEINEDIDDKKIIHLIKKRIVSVIKQGTPSNLNVLIENFLLQVKTDNQKFKTYEGKYKELKRSAKFGQGNLADVPWMAFTGYDQEVSKGITPVLLYYKEQRILISAFGISTDNDSERNWEDTDNLQTIEQYFKERYNGKPKKYGNSYVEKVFEEPIDQIDLIIESLDKVIKAYHQLFTDVSALNTILYGPPGTGKTYSTREKAVRIINPDWCNETHRPDHRIKNKYDELVGDGQIVFTTFHQSFSYEDFIQGISAELNGEILEYRVKSGIFKKLCDEADENPNEKYVLIIDEINRGNISKIFGELITLLEKDKRKDAKNELLVKLPYSNDGDKLFSVPNNVYVIGTMNTADKSLANIDLALRRRFDFEEMPPKYDLLEGRIVQGVDIRQLLETINQRIEVLIDRDHLIGHSYMLGIDSINGLKKVFEKNIIPLLQEYFYDDWRRIRWVLNDHRKNNENYEFIRKGGDTTVDELFGNDIVGEVNDRRFYINQEAFGNIESYTGIVNNND